jgi:NitT/TauT family transport system substrate-binding protein
MKKLRLLLAVLAALAVLLAASCTGSGTPDTTTSSPAGSQTGEQSSTVPTDDTQIKVAVLNGTTGFGIAPLYNRASSGEVANISIELYSDATLIPPQVISKAVDIAAVPTNLAATLYNKTGGGVQVLCVNTLGVLYLVENGNTVNSVADLAGKTVCVPGQGSNPEYVLRSLLTLAGIADKVRIDYTYTTPDELTSALSTGIATLGVIPEPKVTAALTKNASLRTAIDFSSEWKSMTGVELVQGCLVVRKEFAEQHPAAVARFLAEYESSVATVTGDTDAAAKAVVAAGIAASEALVKNALPRCNITFLTGSVMESSLQRFWQALYDVIPTSVGGAVPSEDVFYRAG